MSSSSSINNTNASSFPATSTSRYDPKGISRIVDMNDLVHEEYNSDDDELDNDDDIKLAQKVGGGKQH